MADTHAYATRIDATNFALANDDGSVVRDYERADVILVGVSRSGKTPTCLYLAMQYGIFAANYPLTEDDLESRKLPRALEAYARKLFGLTIKPDRLQQIRNERRPDSRYSSARAGGVRSAGGGVACSSGTAFRCSMRPKSRSKKSPAEFSTAPASSGDCGPDNPRAAWYSSTHDSGSMVRDILAGAARQLRQSDDAVRKQFRAPGLAGAAICARSTTRRVSQGRLGL